VTSPSQRPLPDNTQHSQQTDLHALDGIRTHNPSKREAADPRLRPRGNWDRPRGRRVRVTDSVVSKTTNKFKQLYNYARSVNPSIFFGLSRSHFVMQHVPLFDDICAILRYYAAWCGNFYRRFGTTYRSHILIILDFLNLKMGTDTLFRNVGKQLPHDAA
jgi:hypothetical protein